MEELQIKEILDKLEMMKEIVTTFINVIGEENTALKNNDVKAVKGLFEQKIKVVAAYRSMSAFFIKHREAIARFNGAEKDELKNLSLKLNDMLKTNELLLKTQMEAGKKVMDTFINIAKTTNNSNATSYGAGGNYTPLDNNRNALAYNRTL